MKVSVLIPAYNAAKTIGETLDSVLKQTAKPYEILIIDDGSTDETAAILKSYGPAITVFTQTNHGVTRARNFLCEKASGDVIAFVDSDDLWYPDYLKTQCAVLKKFPDAVASFTRYRAFRNQPDPAWAETMSAGQMMAAKLPPQEFFALYNSSPIYFLPSFCCIPRRFLSSLGSDMFPMEISRGSDFYMFNLLPLLGPVALNRSELGAYRLTPNSLSSNHLLNTTIAVQVYGLLAERSYPDSPDPLTGLFQTTYASLRRKYAKHLMGAGRIAEAREQLRLSLKESGHLLSWAKSLGLHLTTFLPEKLQPEWPAVERDRN